MWIYSKMWLIPAVFSASLLQSSVSHDPSEITLMWWFDAQETFLIIIYVENSCAAYIFVQSFIVIVFFLINRKFK